MAVLKGIWANAPIWVWPLFFVLLTIGRLATRQRKSSVIPYVFYPLFGLTAANSIGSLPLAPLNWQVFAVGYIVGAFVAFRWQNRIVLAKSGRQLDLKGEWITLMILMVIYFSNFVSGVLQAVAPDVIEQIWFVVLFAGLIGATSGSFTGRAVRVLTLRSRTPAHG